MKIRLFILFSFITSIALSQENPSFNVLSIPNGCYIVKAPKSYQSSSETAKNISAWTKEALIDENATKGWSTAKGQGLPLEFIFELPEECMIEKLGFNNSCEQKHLGICAKDIKVEFSTNGLNGTYKEIGKYTLKEYEATTYFPLSALANARWIRITILSNYGNKEYTELMEIEAWGKYKESNPKPINITGDWESTWGLASIRQNGSMIKGCYTYENGKIENGGMDRRIVTYTWLEPGQRGKVVLVVNEEGTRMNGIWGYGDNLKTYGIWVFRKKADIPSLCYTKEDNSSAEQMKTELNEKGKLILYGINFEFNSATIKPESYVVLNDIAQLLKNNPSLKIRIEGHTDDVGTDDFNQTLSLQRAESVKKYLVSKSTSYQARIQTSGKGEKQPIADNNSSLGRAANRRVELIPIE